MYASLHRRGSKHQLQSSARFLQLILIAFLTQSFLQLSLWIQMEFRLCEDGLSANENFSAHSFVCFPTICHSLPLCHVTWKILGIEFQVESNFLSASQICSQQEFAELFFIVSNSNASVETGNFSYATLPRSCVLLYGKYRIEINALMNPEGKESPVFVFDNHEYIFSFFWLRREIGWKYESPGKLLRH